MDDAHIFGPSRQQDIFIGLAGVALVGGDEAGGELCARSTHLSIVGDVLARVDTSGHEDRDVVAELSLERLHLGQYFGQDLVEGLAFSGQKLFFRKAQMPTGLAALDDHEVGGAVEGFCPPAEDELCSTSAGHDGCQRNVSSFHQAGQLQREARTRYDGIHTCLHSSADGVGVVLGGDHRVDGHQSRAVGDLFRFGDFFFQRTEICCVRVAGKIGFSVACVGGGDAPHAAAGRDRTGQPAEGDADAHAAL